MIGVEHMGRKREPHSIRLNEDEVSLLQEALDISILYTNLGEDAYIATAIDIADLAETRKSIKDLKRKLVELIGKEYNVEFSMVGENEE